MSNTPYILLYPYEMQFLGAFGNVVKCSPLHLFPCPGLVEECFCHRLENQEARSELSCYTAQYLDVQPRDVITKKDFPNSRDY